MLILGGATATGKSTLAIELAKRLDGEIVSADSMQIYKYMDIGTAKVTNEEAQGIPHHMIDIVLPSQEFSVALYQKQAQDIVKEILNRGKTPIVVGGTGLYIDSLIYPLQFSSSYKDDSLRKKLQEQAQKFGNDYIYQKLVALDPYAAKKIHKNNIKRIIRAIEIKTLCGYSIAEEKDKKNRIESYHKIFALNINRGYLYKKINKRVDQMFKEGLFEEVDNLIKKHSLNFDCQSMQGIGYKEFYNYYRGYICLEEVKELIKKNTRRYAKRQFTWFRRYKDCNWIEHQNDIDELCKVIIGYYKQDIR